VPVFGHAWDLGPALRLRYRDPSLTAFPIASGAPVACGATGFDVGAGGAAEDPAAPYGRTVLVDARSGRAARARDARDCRRALAAIRPGPASA
jgi:hypothetical protein